MQSTSLERAKAHIAALDEAAKTPQIVSPPEAKQVRLDGPIGIGVPSGDFVDTEFAMSMCTMLTKFPVPHVLISARGCYVHKGRNHLVKVAQEKKCSYLLQLDSDMTFPAETLIRLLSHQKDIVGCMYSRRVAPFQNLGTPKDRTLTKVGAQNELVEMLMVPTGILLTKMSVFDRLKRPYFDFRPSETDNPDDELGEDVNFCRKAVEAGLQLWMDPALSAQVGHIGQATYRVDDRTKAAAFILGEPLHKIDGVAAAEQPKAVAAE